MSLMNNRVRWALWRENGESINGYFERLFGLALDSSKLCDFMRGTNVEDSTLFCTWTLKIKSVT